MKYSAAFTKLVSMWLLACMLLSLSACKTPDTDQDSEETNDQPPYQRPIYEDLSMSTVPIYQSAGAKSCTVHANGQSGKSEVVLDFTQMDGRYLISPTKINFSCHNVAECDQCGYVTTEDGGAYRMSSDGLDQGGVTITLATPILASSVQSMHLTFKTTADAPTSEMRILSADQTNNAAFLNTCANMGGASEQYVTIDLGVKDFSQIADSDGYIRSFQMYFRNKNKVDCYVQSVSFAVGAEQLLVVDQVAGNCFFRDGALRAVANTIAARFEEAGIDAEITVNQKKYTKNSSLNDGHLHYGATAVLADGTKLSASHDLAIPAIRGAWLDATDGQYGSSHDSFAQWQQTLDPSGMLFLTDNEIGCAEGIVRMEYAVIGVDDAFDAADVVWLTPQLLQMSENGFAYLFVNASLDLYGVMTEGTQYRLLVRGVSSNGNYVLHTDIPFTYSPLSTKAQDALSAAYAKVQSANLTCHASDADKASTVLAELVELINDPDVAAEVDVYGVGVHSMRLAVSLRYTPDITESRLPEYVLNGERILDVYNYNGDSFAVKQVTVRYGESEGSIALTAPYDGDAHVILASEQIYAHAKASLSQIESVTYGYTREELCTPSPVRLCWTDANATAGKTYTVSISEDPDMSDAVVMTVDTLYAELYNLKIGTQYYWQVRAGNEASLIHTFVTEDGYARFVCVEGVSNVRDIGGYYTMDGKRVKQDLAFRSAHLDGITEQGRKVALEQLGIRTDLDLRGGSSCPLGSSVTHISVPMQWYDHIFEKEYRADVRDAIRVFAYEENYPIVFHCSMGRDRTGTTSYLILGLLGVDEDTLRHEYYASFFSTQGAFDTQEFPLLVSNINRLSKELGKYGDADDTLQQKIEAYLLDIGVTEQEIANIRAILLED